MENNPELTFVSTEVERADETTWVITGDLTIKGVTKPVTIEFEQTGSARDPFGNLRVGFEGSTAINRKDWGLTWNAALETGGVLVSERVKLDFDICAIQIAPDAACESVATCDAIEADPATAERRRSPSRMTATRRLAIQCGAWMLPAGLTAAPYTADDLDAVFAVAAAQQQHDIGRVDVEAADFEADWQRPSFDFATHDDGRLRRGPAGRVRRADRRRPRRGRRAAGVPPPRHRHRPGPLDGGRRHASTATPRSAGPVPQGSDGDRLLEKLGYRRPLDQLGAPAARGRHGAASRAARRATRSGPRRPTTTRPSGTSSRTPSSSGRSASGSPSRTSSP